MKTMWTTWTVLGAVLASLAATVPAAGADVPVKVAHGATDHFGGGQWVVVAAGENRFGVLYGTAEHPNRPVVFAEYKRYLGGAELVDEQGHLVKKTGIPVFTVVAQSFEFFLEFRDVDNNSRFNLGTLEGDVREPADVPVKTLNLTRAWTLEGPTVTEVEGGVLVDLTIVLEDAPYTAAWDVDALGGWHRRPAGPEDGVLGRFALSFHLNVTQQAIAGEVPWYRVTVDNGNERLPTRAEYLETRPWNGTRTQMGAKYDHDIQGWDFAADDSKLALATGLVFANYFPKPVAQFLHRLRAEYARDDGGHQLNATEGDAGPAEPRLLTKDRITYEDEWERLGRYSWATDVEVDGAADTMYFQVHRGGLFERNNGGRLFRGFWVGGTFVYPRADATLFHDPALEASAAEVNIPTVTNVFRTLFVQAAIVGLAVLAAVGLALWHRQRKKPAAAVPGTAGLPGQPPR